MMALKFRKGSVTQTQASTPDSKDPINKGVEPAGGVSMQGGPSSHPLWEVLLARRQLAIQPPYSLTDIANVLGCSLRAIQKKVQEGKLTVRDIPPYGSRCLDEDVEEFLVNSKKKPAAAQKGDK
jgi:hypothetical protein